MLGERELAMMKNTAIVINAARGDLIDEPALAAGIIRGAAIDAFLHESLPVDSPLHTVGDRIMLSRHSASFNEDVRLGPGMEWASRSVIAAAASKVPDNVFNHDVTPRWTERFGGASATGRS